MNKLFFMLLSRNKNQFLANRGNKLLHLSHCMSEVNYIEPSNKIQLDSREMMTQLAN